LASVIWFEVYEARLIKEKYSWVPAAIKRVLLLVNDITQREH